MVRTMHARCALGSCCLAFLGLGGACSSGTETGNPSLSGALSYTGYSSDPDYGVREGGTLATVHNAWLDLGDVRVSASGACGIQGGGAFTVPALGVGDHAAGDHNSTGYSAKPGSFCSVELPFSNVPAEPAAGGLPDELRGRSLLIVGSLADGTPFSIASSATPVLALRADGEGFLLSVERADTLLAFDFSVWLKQVDFAAAERNDGKIVISPSSNSALLAPLEANLAAGAALYLDRDADGLLDPAAELLAHSE